MRDRIGPFGHASFSVYWAGGLLSNIGTWLQTVAASIFVYQLTGSPLAVGVLNFAAFLPILLLSLVGGVVADRFDRRLVVIVTHAVSGSVAAGLAAFALAGQAGQIHVMVAAFAINTSYAIAKPALASLIPDLVPRDELHDAIGLNTFQFVSGQLIGPTLATIVIATAGAPWAFAINSVTFLGPILSMLYLLRHGIGGSPRQPRGHATRPIQGATSYIREHRWVVSLLAAVFSTSAALEVIRTLAPALVVVQLGAPESTAGILVAAQSVGSAVGLALFVPLNRSGLARPMASVAYLLQAGGLLGAAFSTSLAPAVVSIAFIGLGFALCFPVLTGELQATVPDAVRGRIMSLHTISHLGNRPFSALAVGALASLFTAHWAVLGGLLLAPLGLTMVRLAWAQLGREREPMADETAGARLPSPGS